MAAVIGYLIAASIAICTAVLVAGPRYVVMRDPTFEIGDVSARHVTRLGGLAAFAVTGIIFLVTQAQNVADPSGVSFTTVLAMFVVAYMGYFSSSLLFANVSHLALEQKFDLAAAQYVGASISLFSIFLGWFALVPLFEAFSLTRIADLVSWLLVGALVVGYSQLASALNRSGYASVRVAALLPVIAVVATLVYALGIGVLAPELRSAEATLALTHVAFVLGVPAYAIHMVLPIAARRRRVDKVVFLLAERWADSTAWSVNAPADAAGGDGSRGDLRPDHATRDFSLPRASRGSSSSIAKLPSFRAALLCVGEPGRSW